MKKKIQNCVYSYLTLFIKTGFCKQKINLFGLQNKYDFVATLQLSAPMYSNGFLHVYTTF